MTGRGDQASADLTLALENLSSHRCGLSGLSQAQMALRNGCNRSRVSRALSGDEVPSLHLILQIADLLGVDASEQRPTRLGAAHAHAEPEEALLKGMLSHEDLLAALQELLQERGITHRELVRRDPVGLLNRLSIGASLRGGGTASSAGRDLGNEFEQVPAAGSREDRRRWHRRAGAPRGRRW